jgi:hypothetical protein
MRLGRFEREPEPQAGSRSVGPACLPKLVTQSHLQYGAALIRASLDKDAKRQLARLRKTTVLTNSELVRRGLQALAALPVRGSRRRNPRAWRVSI